MNNLCLRVKITSSGLQRGYVRQEDCHRERYINQQKEKWDSTRLGKRKMYCGNKELYILVQKAALRKEGRISSQSGTGRTVLEKQVQRSSMVVKNY